MLVELELVTNHWSGGAEERTLPLKREISGKISKNLKGGSLSVSVNSEPTVA